MRHYARGEALARRGDAAAVRAEAAAHRSACAAAPRRRRSAAPARALAEIFQRVLEGRAAMLAGDLDAAERAYRSGHAAASAPPISAAIRRSYWYSVRRSLAAARLAQGDARGARAQLRASLRHWPNDPLALYALSLAERRLGRAPKRSSALAQARAIWAGEVTEVPLSRI